MAPVVRSIVHETVRKKLDKTALPYLPMPHQVIAEHRRVLACEEWEEYRQRWSRHTRAMLDYEARLGRPTVASAKQVWALFEPFGLTLVPDFTPDYQWLEPDEKVWLPDRAKQAFLIILDTFVRGALNNFNVTFNAVFDTLALRFSDNFWAGPASTVRDTTYERVQRCRRDLLVNGIRLKPLWTFVTGPWSSPKGSNPLFSTSKLDFGGYQVLKRETSQLSDFLTVLENDDSYAASWSSGLHLLTADESPPPLAPVRSITADCPYNVVELEKKSTEILSHQVRARLLLDADQFLKDYNAAQSQEKELLTKIKEEFGLNANLSNAKRWVPDNPDSTASGSPTRRRSRGAGWERAIWSPREEELYYLSYDKAFSAGWVRDDDANLEHACREQLSQDDPKFKQNIIRWTRHVAKYLARTAPSDLSTRLSIPDVVKAHLASADWRRTLKDLLGDYDRARTLVSDYRHVATKVRTYREHHGGDQTPVQYIPIKSGFYRIINRRYQPTHFWPTFVSARNLEPDDPRIEFEDEQILTSYRERWFRVEDRETRNIAKLVGLDVSSSQTQILAILLNLRELETQTQRGWKKVMAERVWSNEEYRNLLWEGTKPYDKPEDERLQELLKTLWMRLLYGSTIPVILDDLRSQPELFGATLSYKSASKILDSWDEFKELKWYRSACDRLVKLAYERDPYAGVIFTDPYDNARVRWNPVHRVERRISSDDQKLLVMQPGSYERHHGQFVMDKPRKTGAFKGEYRADRAKLENMVAPCLVHMLDAHFSSLVMEHLVKCGVRDFVGIHDCWLVPERLTLETRSADGKIAAAEVDGLTVLRTAVDAATRDWFEGLGRIYDQLLDYLKDDKLSKHLTKIRNAWQVRLEKGDFPTFYVS